MPPLGSVEDLNEKRRRAAARDKPFVPDPVRDLLAYLRHDLEMDIDGDGIPEEVSEVRLRDEVLLRTTTHETTATGHALDDRLVSRMEVLTAMTSLPPQERAVVECLFVKGLSRRETCRALHINDREMHDRRNRALGMMVLAIYEWPRVERSGMLDAA